MDRIRVQGAKQHNLKDVSIDLPRHRLVVITGPSGSGKSSLAFDTIYAEGQRRYVESLSAYARQFLNQLPKPDVRSIEGLSPAIAIEQRALGKSPRSTVGTVTEIADYLRLLFARAGTPHCPVSGQVLQAYTVQEIVDRILAHPEGTRLTLLSPIARAESGDLAKRLRALRSEGFVRARLNGETIELAELPQEAGISPYDLEAVIDRVVVRASAKGRVADSVELALKLSGGTVFVLLEGQTAPEVLSENLVSWEHGITLPPLEPRLFSFNSPQGACPECEGLGTVTRVDPTRLVGDAARSLREGALVALGPRGSARALKQLAQIESQLKVDLDTPWAQLPTPQQEAILFGKKAKTKARSYRGLVAALEKSLDAAPKAEPAEEPSGEPALDDVARFATTRVCERCEGARLRREALSVRFRGADIAELSRLPLESLHGQLSGWLEEAQEPDASEGQRNATKDPVAAPLLKAIVTRLGFLNDVGLGYLSLDRPAPTLSGGEGQRIRLATQIGAALVGVLYVLDEPSVGLHARDNQRLLLALRQLVNKGNSVLAVEHDREAMSVADYVVDMGPAAGVQGGYVVAEGTPAEIMANPKSVTGAFLSGARHMQLPERRAAPSGRWLSIVNARAHNLKSVTARIPIGLFTAVTGVSGAGKSGLVVDTLLSAARARLYRAGGWIGPHDTIDGLEHIDKVVSIDQAPIGRTPRSNPATYTGILTQLRELFAGLPEARARGYKAGRFSFNVKGGRCEACQGDGVRRVEMHFLPDIYVRCSACDGMRYNRETLEVRYRGLSIAETLNLTVDEAAQLFDSIPRLTHRLAALREIGLGYLQLGQAATTLSGGEAQRVKLAAELSRKSTGKTLYVLDEPTTGLHFTDIELLVQALYRLRDAGNTLVVIEHNLDLVACADWALDLGPGGGAGGGQLLAAGTPEEVSQAPQSVTGPFLAEALARS